MRILILSASVGAGHIRAAEAVEAALRAGMKCVVLTTMHEKEEFQQYPNILGYIADYRDPSLDALFL